MTASAARKPDEFTVAQRLAAALVRHGVEAMFSQSLPSALILACEDAGIRQVVYRTENAGGAMADGYARRTNRIGIVTAQNGPAAALLVAPLAEALKASIPVVALVQEVNRTQADRNAFQELDHLQLFASCTKWVRKLTDASRAEDYLDMAITAATSSRPGPVALLLPADVLIERCAPSAFRRSIKLGHWPLDRPCANREAVREAAAAIASAEHAIVVVGGGVHSSGAYAELAELQSLAALPVAYTMMGKGAVADTAPLCLGLIGNVMGARSLGRQIRPLIDQADLIVFVGTRTNQNGTDSWTLFPKSARFIHVDVDGCEVGRTYEALRLVGDARETLRALVDELGKLDLARLRAGSAGIAEQIRAAKEARDRANASVMRQGESALRPEIILRELDQLLTPDTTVVADASYASVWIAAYLNAAAAGARFITPRGLAGLGWGFPLAIGVKAAQPRQPVVCVVGDGGFGHVWGELETAAREELGIVVLLLNNGVLGFQKDAETVKFGRYTRACRFAPVDHAAIAAACGLRSHRIERTDQIRPALRNALAARQSTLIELIIDANAYPPLTMYDNVLDY